MSYYNNMDALQMLGGMLGILVALGWLFLASLPYIFLICVVTCAIKFTIRFLFR
jgi:hypothetical protein